MNQSTSNTNPALEGAANGEASTKATGQRRYRRPARAKSTAAQPVTATPLEVSTSVPSLSAATKQPATKQPATKQPAKTEKGKREVAKEPVSAGSAQLEAIPGPEMAEAAAPAAPTRPRTRRNNSRRNKGDVHLVVPPAPNGPTPESTSAADAVEIPAEAYSLPTPVPVLTEPTQFDGAIPSHPAPEPEEPASPLEPAPRRYRFDRRVATDGPTATPLRPERLSGLRSVEAGTETPSAEVATGPEAGEPIESPESPETPAAAEESFNFFTPHPTSTYTRGTTGDDILSELGLGEAQHESEDAEPGVELDHNDDHFTGATLASVPEASDTAEEITSTAASGESESGTGTRRRRRRRRSSPHVVDADEETPESLPAAEYPWSDTEPVSSTSSREAARPVPTDRPYVGPAAEANHNTPPFPPYTPAPPDQPSWGISSGQQYIRREDSPFGAPAPSFARGFGPQPRGVANPARDLYTARPARSDRGTDTPPMSPNQLANMVSSSIAQQTDRLLTEMRYQQHPPSMTVMFPPLPSTERVGIFVDVANLLYSARSLRINIDFGRLLEFLRGNRRLIRAHAYAPTNPDPGADQSFLAAVKGMGYRITTKNYKTFSSGAKKADMDLDLCMDIVRLVDAGALDTVVLVSGDSDFLPLLEYCSDHGVRVEAAAFDDSAAMILRQSCDLFINLTVATDIRA